MSTTLISFETFANNVRQWAEARELLGLDNYTPQLSKLQEELYEFIEAVHGENQSEINKEWADVLVVWLIVGMIRSVDFPEAWTTTWEKIKNRKGKTIDGQFVKEV